MGERCFHCGAAIPADCPYRVRIGDQTHALCCAGCEAAVHLVLAQGLERYYQFREGEAATAVGASGDAALDYSAFDRDAALRRYTHLMPDGRREWSLSLEGLHCAACSWLIQNSLARLGGVCSVEVNAPSARAELSFDAQQVTPSQILRHLQQLGYRAWPVDFTGTPAHLDDERRAALKRLGVAGFGMMQVMTFATSLYVGAWDGITPELAGLLRFVSLIVSTPVVLYSAQPFFVGAWRGIRAGTLGMDVPVALSIAVAYAWSLVATLRGQGQVYFDAAVMFTFFLSVGRFIEMSLYRRSGLQREALKRLLPTSALRVTASGTERVLPEELVAADRLRILPGERVPADGLVLSGSTEVDESLLTGEATPRVRNPGDEVTAGSVNLNGVIEISVTRIGQDSTLASISRLLERARASRPRFAQVADRVASRFVGVVVLLALLVGAYWWHAEPAKAMTALLAVLVATCPCALSLAMPVAIAAATTRLSWQGMLLARGSALESLARADRVIFDKTGTVTRGEPRIVRQFDYVDPPAGLQWRWVAATLEARSQHPIARAFAGSAQLPAEAISIFPAQGIEGWVAGVRYRIGRPEFVRQGLSATSPAVLGCTDDSQQSIELADDRQVLAQFILEDALRDQVANTLADLGSLGLSTLLASGDRAAVVSKVAAQVGAERAHGDLSASGKLALLQSLQHDGHVVMMVGDGVNDAPVLAAADVSVALASGTDLAKVSADLVVVGEDLKSLVSAVTTARSMSRIVRQNFTWAILYNAMALPLAASGALIPWVAAIGMSASSLLVVANALRLLRLEPVAGGQPVVTAPPRLQRQMA